MPLVSVVMPAYHADATIARAVRSALAQTHDELEILVVADDRRDYGAVLAAAGVVDERVLHLSSGKLAGGAPAARNVGLDAVRGDFVTLLDADDLMQPHKLERLLPLAEHHGVAYDNVAVVDDATGTEVYRAFRPPVPERLDVAAFFSLDTPLIGLIRRDLVEPQDPTVDVAEDVLMNLRLIDRCGGAPLIPEVLCEYRILATSVCNDDSATDRFERGYATILALLPSLPLSRKGLALATHGFTKKRDLNRDYASARRTNAELTFQEFVASQNRTA